MTKKILYNKTGPQYNSYCIHKPELLTVSHNLDVQWLVKLPMDEPFLTLKVLNFWKLTFDLGNVIAWPRFEVGDLDIISVEKQGATALYWLRTSYHVQRYM